MSICKKQGKQADATSADASEAAKAMASSGGRRLIKTALKLFDPLDRGPDQAKLRFRRLVQQGLRGEHIPQVAIKHFAPAERRADLGIVLPPEIVACRPRRRAQPLFEIRLRHRELDTHEVADCGKRLGTDAS